MAFKLNILFTLIIYSFFLIQIYAVPAYPGNIIFKQTDGSTFIGKLKGDEWFNWIESENGHIVLRDLNTYEFQYAQINIINGLKRLKPSGIKSKSPLNKFFKLCFNSFRITFLFL